MVKNVPAVWKIQDGFLDQENPHEEIAHLAPLSMGFPRKECWSGLPFPCPKYSIQFSSVQSLSRV